MLLDLLEVVAIVIALVLGLFLGLLLVAIVILGPIWLLGKVYPGMRLLPSWAYPEKRNKPSWWVDPNKENTDDAR